MRIACLINHYQYGEYVTEAVDSVLAQSREMDEIVLVDDGSDETHVARARDAAARDKRIRLIEKPNGGQLSCFQTGLSESTAELVIFLDADDVWEPEYAENVLELLKRRPDVDVVATNERHFFPDGKEIVTQMPDRDLGYSMVHSLHKLRQGGAWVGGPTSCLAMRRSILDKIFPVPNPKAWPVCADQALVYGSSLVGARKYFLGTPLVGRRIHGNNYFVGKRPTAEDAFTRRIEWRRLREHLRRRESLPISLIDIVDYEFRTIENPTRREYQTYCRLLNGADIPVRLKARLRVALFRDYYGLRGGGG